LSSECEPDHSGESALFMIDPRDRLECHRS
jgi:hypothetical protein